MPRRPKNGNAAPRRRRPAATPTAPPAVTPPSQTAIAARAYELYLMRGGAHGHDFDDWLAAERELRPLLPLSDSGRR
jgi:hypothetical protein